jgi:hypothetical protein
MFENFIFVNYSPGSFGSFLAKNIESSSSVDKFLMTATSNFDSTGSAHNNISRWIGGLHDGQDLIQWLAMNHEEKTKFILKTYNLDNNKKLKVHRLTLPTANLQFHEFFSTSKFVKITFHPDRLNIIAEAMAKKTFQTYLIKEQNSNKIKYQIMQRLSVEQQLTAYSSICRKWIVDIMSDSLDPNTFNFDIENFYNYNSFKTAFNKLCIFLEIEEPDIESLYNEFYKINQQYITKRN